MLIESVYDITWPKLVAMGFLPLPIGPGTKKPQRYTPSLNRYEDMTGWTHPSLKPVTTPQPGAGVGVRLGRQQDGTCVVALDWDDEDVAGEALGAFPDRVGKVGKRGFTTFYRTSGEIPSKDFRVGGAVKVQLLSTGRQTVLPPTMHPDTGQPYRWWSADATLLNTPATQLPELPADYAETIRRVLGSSGLELDFAEGAGGEPVNDTDSPFKEINDLALKNLPAWVPALGLYRCRRAPGPSNYEAVPIWRPSSTGRPPEDRKLNLKISGGKGITDFGNGDTFSPLDLVMRAKGRSLSEAHTWLSDLLKPAGPEIDFEALHAKAEAKTERGAEEKAAPKDEEDDPFLGRCWEHGDPLPALEPMLVPHFVTAHGYGYIGGQWGTFKTFILDDLAVAVASGGEFAGQQVTKRGAVVMVELEGSGEARLLASIASRGIEGRLPIKLSSKDPPAIILSGKINPQFQAWCRRLVHVGNAVARKHKVPLAMISIDPQNRVAGFKDEQSSAEAQVVANAWLYLADLAKCVVIVVDHYGKDSSAGLRGSSAKESNPMFILGTSDREKDVYAKRYLEVRRQKNGRSGIAIDFAMAGYEVEVERRVAGADAPASIEPTTHNTLVVQWEGDFYQLGERDRQGEKKPPSQKQRCLSVLGKLMREFPIAHAEAPGGFAVQIGRWYEAVEDDGLLAAYDVPKRGFYTLQAALTKDGLIGIDRKMGVAWAALPEPR